MSDKPIVIVLEKRESMWQSIVSDSFTFTLLFTAMWVSWQADLVIQWVVAFMFVVYILSAGSKSLLKMHTFYSKRDFVEWVQDTQL